VNRAILLFVLTFAVAFAEAETEPDPEPSPRVDPKVFLQISVAAKNNEFRMGEKIPVTLAFNTRVKNRYELDEADYDRSGRLPSEHFTITPGDGAEDPLADYFGPDTAHIGGGLRGFRILTQKPWTIVLNLNEWVRFTKPGEYKLTVSSDRVEILDSSKLNGKARVTVVSNPITLKIVARDPAWERQALNDAIAKLNAPGPLKRTTTQGSFEASRLEAAETLRFLGSVDAVRELVRQMGVENSGIPSTCFFGIISSPERAVASEALAEALAAPDYPITDDFLDTLQWIDRKESARDTLAKVVRALPNKRGPAARVTLYTIINDVWVRGDDRLLTPETKRELIKQLTSIFDQLPIDQQAWLLEQRWPDIKDPALLPLLKQFVEIDVNKIPPDKFAWARDLPGVALRRWFELDPASARPAVIAEISRAQPRIKARELSLLPDETVPEVEQALADHFTAAEDYSISSNLAALIERYATRAILPQVLRKLDHTKADDPACEIVTPILAYILRVDPAGALPHVEKSIAKRRKKGSECTGGLLSTVAQIHYDPVLEPIALRLLEDSNLSVAGDAASMLSQFGSSSAEPLLWRRYEKWSKRWAGRERELNFSVGLELYSVRSGELSFGKGLFEAIATGQAWVTDEAKLRRLKAVNKVQSIEFAADQYLERWKGPRLYLDLSPVHPFRATVVQYTLSSMRALKDKLGQFPPGTKFTLFLSMGEPESIADVRAFLESHGMSLEEEKRSE
jgi:hypothetical protein